MYQLSFGFIGGGNMAASLIGGLVPNTLPAERVLVAEPNAERRAYLAERFGVRAFEDNAALIATADVVVLAIKPQVMRSALQPLAAACGERKPLIISIAAGVPVSAICRWLDGEYAVVRAMPNTPALVGRGIAGLYANPEVSDAQREIAGALLDAVGKSVWVASEADIDAVTALSGSGPAYFMLFMRALGDAATDAGLDAGTARLLAQETAAGAAALAASVPESLQQLIANVTSPGGTTERALASFDQAGFDGIVAEAFHAAHRRSRELSTELGV